MATVMNNGLLKNIFNFTEKILLATEYFLANKYL